MIIPIAGLLALLSPALTGGRLRRFADIRLRFAWLVVLALGAQVVVIEIVPEGNHALLSAAHIATYLVAGGFVWLNRRIPGLWIIAVGAASNAIAITANNGTLPASAAALRRAGLPVRSDEFVNSGVLADPKLGFLGDVFAIPAGWPLANVFSIGDLLIVLGAAWGAHRICGSALVPAWRRDVRPAIGDTASQDVADGVAGARPAGGGGQGRA